MKFTNLQVNKKVSELDSTKARLRLLEQNVVNKDSNNMVGNSAAASVKLVGKVVGNNSSGKSDQDVNSHKSQQASSASHSSGAHQQPNTTTSSHKSENHRVHFDLNNATSSAEIRKPARTSRPNGANVATRQNTVHLPSDARQKLEQLVIWIKHACSIHYLLKPLGTIQLRRCQIFLIFES